MSKPTFNNHFTNPCRLGMQQATESSFEQVVQALRLAPGQYAASPELRAWVRRNKRYKYVPPDLLLRFGFRAAAEV